MCRKSKNYRAASKACFGSAARWSCILSSGSSSPRPSSNPSSSNACPPCSAGRSSSPRSKVNPYALSLTLRGLAVNEKNGAPFAGFDEFYARLKFSSFFQHGWSLQEIHLTHPFAGIVRAKDGKLNFGEHRRGAEPAGGIAAAARQIRPAAGHD